MVKYQPFPYLFYPGCFSKCRKGSKKRKNNKIDHRFFFFWEGRERLRVQYCNVAQSVSKANIRKREKRGIRKCKFKGGEEEIMDFPSNCRPEQRGSDVLETKKKNKNRTEKRKENVIPSPHVHVLVEPFCRE
jgi:hypothetical protein